MFKALNKSLVNHLHTSRNSALVTHNVVFGTHFLFVGLFFFFLHKLIIFINTINQLIFGMEMHYIFVDISVCFLK